MTKEDRNLLLIDLCARLPYNVKVYYDNKVYTIDAFAGNSFIISETPDIAIVTYPEDIKPYLIPLYRMTDEQKSEMLHLSVKECDIIEYIVNNPTYYTDGFPVVTYYLVDFCNKNHLDFRGLIEKGLALDATNLNIY